MTSHRVSIQAPIRREQAHSSLEVISNAASTGDFVSKLHYFSTVALGTSPFDHCDPIIGGGIEISNKRLREPQIDPKSAIGAIISAKPRNGFKNEDLGHRVASAKACEQSDSIVLTKWQLGRCVIASIAFGALLSIAFTRHRS